MSLIARNYDPALKYGADVTGQDLVENSFFGSTAVLTNGTTTYVNLFAGSNKAQMAGTITNVTIVAGDTTKGTIDLVSDQGTLVRLIKNGTLGGITGSMITPIAFQAGSLLTVISAGVDNAVLEATFYTSN
jgi:hypothetical protein